MEKQIWKFKLNEIQWQTIAMPETAEILTLQSQFNEPYIWALVDPNEQQKDRHFEIIGTGHSIYYGRGNREKKYIGTYQTDGGNYVFHVFEII